MFYVIIIPELKDQFHQCSLGALGLLCAQTADFMKVIVHRKIFYLYILN